MFDWLNNLPEAAKGPVYAAIIVGVFSLVTVILTFIVKEYFIPRWLENWKKSKTDKIFLIKYKLPFLEAIKALDFRLKEIFSVRSFFLLDDVPTTEFYKYKYISTIYRLCAVIGWIRAIKLEAINMVISAEKLNATLDKAIDEFNKNLADGQHVEISIATNICATWQLDTSSRSKEQFKQVGTAIDHLMQEFYYTEKLQLASELSREKQIELMTKVKNEVCRIMNFHDNIDVIPDLDITIQELSVKSGLLYRDWQQAIGDLMIKKNEGGLRIYDVIGFKQFELMCLRGNEEEKLWIKRVERMFTGVDIKFSENRFDTRVEQLRKVHQSLNGLMGALEKIK